MKEGKDASASYCLHGEMIVKKSVFKGEKNRRPGEKAGGLRVDLGACLRHFCTLFIRIGLRYNQLKKSIFNVTRDPKGKYVAIYANSTIT